MKGRPWLILFVAWLGWVFDIMDTALFNFAKVPMFAQLHGPNLLKEHPAIDGQMQAVFVLGWAVGGIVFGVMADRWSRPKTMALTVVIYALFTGLTAFCQSWEQVTAVRFFTALGIGGEWAAGASMIAEAFEEKFRPTAAALLQTAAAFGPWLAALLNVWIVVPNVPVLGLQPWQALFLVGVLPAVAAFFMRLSLGRESHPSSGTTAQPLSSLFGDTVYRSRVLLIMIVGAVGIAGAGNASYWLPNLVKEASAGLSPAEVAVRTSQVTLSIHAGTLIGVFLFPWLAKVWGRRKALATGYVAGILTTVLLFFAAKTYEGLLLFAPVLGMVVIGVSAVFGLYFPELFPRRMRATGAGFGYNAARILQFPLPILTAMWASQSHGSIALGMAIAGSVYVLGLAALWFLPETKGQALAD